MRQSRTTRLDTRIQAVPLEHIEHGVEVGLEQTASKMLSAFSAPKSDPISRHNAFCQFALYAVAKDELEGSENSLSPFEAPSWVRVAREELVKFAGDDESRQILKNTGFFEHGWAEYEELNRRIFGNIIEPGRTYTGREFAAGVVIGEITIKQISETSE